MRPRGNGISIILGSYNRRPFLKKTIESIRNNGVSEPYEIIVIDGGSTDGSLRYLAKQKDIVTIIQHNRGTWRGKPIERRSWGYFMNLGFKAAQGKYICMISDDCLLVPGSVMNGYRRFEALLESGRKVGAVAFYWRQWPEGNAYQIGLTLGGKMFVNHGMYLRTALEDVGWIEEDRYRFYHADGDLCLKLWQAGYEVVDCKEAFVEHYGHVSLTTRRSNYEDQEHDKRAYLNAWQGIYYDPKTEYVGEWVHLPFEDISNTAGGFRWLHLMRSIYPIVLCRRILSILKNATLRAIRRKGHEVKDEC
jgi:glycosyltransferase involved in cell wall biosynthesis